MFGVIAGVLVVSWFLFLEFQDDVCGFFDIEKRSLPSWMIIEEEKNKKSGRRKRGVWDE